jgi:hypothetical protein
MNIYICVCVCVCVYVYNGILSVQIDKSKFGHQKLYKVLNTTITKKVSTNYIKQGIICILHNIKLYVTIIKTIRFLQWYYEQVNLILIM